MGSSPATYSSSIVYTLDSTATPSISSISPATMTANTASTLQVRSSPVLSSTTRMDIFTTAHPHCGESLLSSFACCVAVSIHLSAGDKTAVGALGVLSINDHAGLWGVVIYQISSLFPYPCSFTMVMSACIADKLELSSTVSCAHTT